MGKPMFEPKKLLPLPVLLLLISVALIYVNWSNDTIPMSVDLKGGTVIIIPTSTPIEDLDQLLNTEFGLQFDTRAIRDFTGTITQQEVVINKVDIDPADEQRINEYIIETFKSHSIEHGPLLSQSVSGFFSELFLGQSLKAVLFAFMFMAAVIFLKFRAFIPSFAVVLSAFADIAETIAAMTILGIEFSKGSIVALLLLIGYSVDTDIMLTSRLLKQRGKNLDETIKNSIYTGLTMTGTTTTAMIVLFIVSTSELLDSIATVIIIGLIFDMLNTWITNLALLKMHVEAKRR